MDHLAGVVVCISGEPRDDRDKNKHIREQFTDENVSKWIKCRGGQLVEEVTKATTHLICARAAYSKKNQRVKAARKYGCHIVTYEWLTDTFQLWDYLKRRAPPELYHPGDVRDGEAISDLFKKSVKKARPVKKVSPTETGSTPVSGGDDARAAGEAAETGSEQLTVSEEKDPQKSFEGRDLQKSSESGEEKGTKVVDDRKRVSMPTKNESDKQPKKPKKGAKVKDQEPPVDLSLYTVCKDESGLRQVEIRKGGCRLILELYQSKSFPKTYLFGTRKYPTPGSSACIRRFPSKTPGEKKHELREFRSHFWDYTGVFWRDRDLIPSDGPYHYRRRGVPGKTIGSAIHKNELDEAGNSNKENTTNSVAVAHKHRQVDLETSFKRSNSCSEDRPAKALKVTKYSVAGGSDKVTNGGYQTA